MAKAEQNEVDIHAFFPDEAERARLSQPAIKAVIRIFRIWSLDEQQAARLLGVSENDLRDMQNGRYEGILSNSQMTRASAIIGLYADLHTLFQNDLADRWITLENKGEIFSGKRPLDRMLEGGIPVMIEARKYLAALIHGN